MNAPDSYGQRVHRWIRRAGRGLVAAGMLVLLFVGYELWGTGVLQASDQRDLKRELGRVVSPVEAPLTEVQASPPPVAPMAVPPAGEALGLISIPTIGVNQAMVEGAERAELQKGPGHYAHSPLPGHRGNVAVAGHRTTYGAPFNRLNELRRGDAIVVETAEGRFSYAVVSIQVVSPSDVSVISPTDDARITLTTCNPKYSARERLVVTGLLDGRPFDEPPIKTVPPDARVTARGSPAASAQEPAPDVLDASASGWQATRWATLAWLSALTAVSVVWTVAHRRWRRWPTALAGVLPFLAVLFGVFGEVERLLAANH